MPRCCGNRSPRSAKPSARRSRRRASAKQRLHAAGMGFFRYYADNPRDLDLGFYLFRGGMKPAGLGHDRDHALNAALEAALHPIAEAAEALGASRRKANTVMVDCFARYRPVALLHTGRIRDVRRLGARS